MIKAYYTLAKPGIIYGNAVTAVAGFFVASKGHFPFVIFLAMLVGISLVMASGCVFNNYMDREIDQKMARTKNRALVKGTISARNALIYATILGLLGALVLGLWTNPLTLLIAFIGFFVYVVLYGISKRRSPFGTIVGSIAGAVPPVVGYTAVSNHFDVAALILFLILVLWQMPHFYAIAIFRSDEYAAADLPVLPLKKGLPETKRQIILYTFAFLVATILLTVFQVTGFTYLALFLPLGIAWLYLGFQGFKADNDKVWARSMFRFSLIVLTALCVIMAIGVVLP